MMEPKLNQKQEREAALAYLCGVDSQAIEQKYSICEATLRGAIVGERSRTWNDPLVEFYRQTNGRNRLHNSAHFYLAYHEEKSISLTEQVLLPRDLQLYHFINESIYLPRINPIIDALGLKQYVVPSSNFENLLRAICGERRPEGIVTTELLPRLLQEYSASARGERTFSLDEVFASVLHSIRDKVKRGALTITPSKEDIV